MAQTREEGVRADGSSCFGRAFRRCLSLQLRAAGSWPGPPARLLSCESSAAGTQRAMHRSSGAAPGTVWQALFCITLSKDQR